MSQDKYAEFATGIHYRKQFHFCDGVVFCSAMFSVDLQMQWFAVYRMVDLEKFGPQAQLRSVWI